MEKQKTDDNKSELCLGNEIESHDYLEQRDYTRFYYQKTFLQVYSNDKNETG